MQELIPEYKEIRVIRGCNLVKTDAAIAWMKDKTRRFTLNGYTIGEQARVIDVEVIKDGSDGGPITSDITLGVAWSGRNYIELM